MASVSSTSSSTTQLDSFYTNIISNIITQESAPLNLLEEQKDTITVKKGIYTDLKSSLETFLTKIKALISTQSTYALTGANTIKATVSGVASGKTVVSATGGTSAVTGDYALDFTQIARTYRARSDVFASATQTLSTGGTFTVGGAASRSIVSSTSDSTVTGFGTAAIATGQKELGRSNYTVETRNSGGTWQFRVVNSEGTAQSVKSVSVAEEYTTEWQNITAGSTYDTGRGLTFTFGASTASYTAKTRLSGASAALYQNQGATLTVSSTDTIAQLASTINNATYAEGQEVSATIVNNQLVLQNKNTGAERQMLASDSGGTVLQSLGILTGGGAYKNQTASDIGQDAIFTVNGISVQRASNTNLTDVISGVTLNIASDAAGQTATVTVANDTSTGRTTVDNFISAFNTLQTYLKDKTGVTKSDDDTYTRGALSTDTMFRTMGTEMKNFIISNVSNSGAYDNLRDIGISLGSDMTLSISDETKFNAAMNTDPASVSKLFDAVMAKFEQKVGLYTGSTGYMSQLLTSSETQLKSLNTRITSYEERLQERRASLTSQYAKLQAQLSALNNQYSFMSSLFSATA